jgi:iron complex transport system permease protein
MLWLVFLMVAALFIGRYQIRGDSEFLNPDSIFWQLFLLVRLPRVLLALLAGAGLAVSGLVMQTVFRNPLADSGIMGVSQGAGFGAALGILFFGNRLIWVQTSSFIFSLVALGLTILLSSEIGRGKILPLVLAGIAVSALFSSGLGIIKYLADPINQLPGIVFWLLGSLSAVNWEILLRSAIIILPLLILFFFYRWRLNIHALDKHVSFSLGMKTSWETYLILSAAVLLTAIIISVSGVVSWVGLIIPNFSRVIFGADTKTTLINTILLGAIFMIICDTLARTLLPGEIPLGIFTALIGSGLFILLLTGRKIRA